MKMPKAKIVEKNIRYRSPIYFTPLRSNTELDTVKIASIIEAEYRAAGIRPADVKTGAVIITGDTARKENAQGVLHDISEYAGDFVVAVAGPALESILAGKGSGAEQYSTEHLDNVCNMDIGGGTTNTATFCRGTLIDTDCLDVGGRLIRFRDGTLEIAYIFPKIQQLAKEQGVIASIGTTLTERQISAITDCMAEAVLEKLKPAPEKPAYFFLKTEKKEKRANPPIHAVSFSGGVGRLLYEPEPVNPLEYGDIGVYLAQSIKKNLMTRGIQVIQPLETIGATVIGAGNHSVNVSGATITITDYGVLPIQNIPILRMNDVLNMTDETYASEFRQKAAWIQGQEKEQNIALNVEAGRKLNFRSINDLADKVVAGAQELLARQDILVVITREDCAKVLGQCLQIRLPEGKKVVCIDSIDVGNGDYIDIGTPVGIGDAVPVVIKTLAFSY